MSDQEKTTVVMKKGPIEKVKEAAEEKAEELKESKRFQIPGWVKGICVGVLGAAAAFVIGGLRKPKNEPIQTTYSYEEHEYDSE